MCYVNTLLDLSIFAIFCYFIIFHRFLILITQYFYNVVMFTTDNLNEFDYHGHFVLDFMFQTAIYLLWCNGFKDTKPSADMFVARKSKSISTPCADQEGGSGGPDHLLEIIKL